MAKYITQLLDGPMAPDGLPRPSLWPLTGLQLARAAPLRAAMRAQDQVLQMGRRVILRTGLSGAATFLVGDGNPEHLSTQQYPLTGVARVIGRATAELTPGHVLSLSAVVCLSGATNIDTGGSPRYIDGGHDGRLRVGVTWYDQTGSSVTTTHDVALPTSTRTYGASAITLALWGTQWGDVRVVRVPVIAPNDYDNPEDWNRWSVSSTAAMIVRVTLSALDGARVVDAIIHETPKVVAYEADDTQWVTHGASVMPAATYPLQRLSELGADGDPRGGSWHLMDVAQYQQLRLGPQLWSWSSWDEDAEAKSVTEGAPVTFGSSTFATVANSSISAWSASQEGQSLSSGAYARNQALNAMASHGAIPVRACIYAATPLGTAGTVRFQTGAYDWVDVTLPSNSAAGWYTAYGHAAVGRGPGQSTQLMVMGRRDSGISSLSLYHASLHYGGQYARAV